MGRVKRRRGKPDTACPCGSGTDYSACCRPFIGGREQPRTAEELMRSRYSAYALGDTRWLRETWHPDTCRSEVEIDPSIKWTRLEIVATKLGGPDDQSGIVEFIAHYKVQGRAHRLHERSRFQRCDGRWYYVDGDLDPGGESDDGSR